jgi:hypothetical protein
MLFSAVLTAVGCYAEEPGPQYAGDDDGSGDLVEVSPGVEVIADYNEPIFFADDFYWVNRGGFWYQSGWYGGGWARAGNVPARISGISHPEAYAHYRPAGYVAHGQIRGGYANHVQYHAAHSASGGVHVRAAVHGGGGGGHGGGGHLG